MAKWANPYRQAHLVNLFVLYGNRCLQGHPVCPHPDHYLQHMPKVVTAGKAIQVPCHDREGNPLRDAHGNAKTITVYKPFKAVIHKVVVCRLYELKEGEAIAYWQADDRAQALAEWQAEQRQIHCLGERGRAKGEFNAIGRDIFFGQQPQHYIDGLGVSGLTFRPFAKVRLASSYVVLFVDIADALRGESKNKRRKALRYGKPLPQETQRGIDQECAKAIRHYRR